MVSSARRGMLKYCVLITESQSCSFNSKPGQKRADGNVQIEGADYINL